MGNYKSRRTGFLEGWKMDAAQWMFEGLSDRDIADRLDGNRIKAIEDDKKRKTAYRAWAAKLQRLRKDPNFQEYYNSIVTEWKVHAYGPSLKLLLKQIDADEPWLANKAANDVLNRVGHDPFSDGKESSEVVFRFEGMPELGEPSTEEEDG